MTMQPALKRPPQSAVYGETRVSRTQRGLAIDIGIGAIVIAYAVLWMAVARLFGIAPAIRPKLATFYLELFLIQFIWYTTIAALVYRIRVKTGKAQPGLTGIWRRGASALWVFVALAGFETIFTSVKVAIPEIHAFTWDPALARADRFLHGGVDPWVWLQPVLGHRFVTLTLALAYSLVWFAVVAAVLGWIAWHGDQRLRTRFLLAWMLTWIILGNVAATLLSSAGPAYYSHVAVGPDPFAPLMEYLGRTVPALVSAQQSLWAAQMGKVPVDAALLGVSAAPSLHVAVPALLAMLMWRESRRLSMALWVYTGIQFLATVHLGWHYAIDGYLGILGATLMLVLTDALLATWRGPGRGNR